MKVVKKTGLVPVHTKKTAAIFGISPAAALKGVQSGELILVPIPDDIETFEFAVAEPKKEAAPVEQVALDIPGAWESMHWAAKVKLAKELLGEDLPEVEGKKAVDVAEDVIRNEVSRRAAGNPETPAE